MTAPVANVTTKGEKTLLYASSNGDRWFLVQER